MYDDYSDSNKSSTSNGNVSIPIEQTKSNSQTCQLGKVDSSARSGNYRRNLGMFSLFLAKFHFRSGKT